ncbi:Transglutaminase-like enzyme, putative cysteine protease [Rubritalea squalenifaciens DSM 18772]|uniref:Transglutaminase-like enzyme, putative cysteine protease n=1 Tax=Rubritalea squalenifaciens DSM 18772 TaxID=1123071 RepID=A0A1M6L7P9_9BACT|nr:transglutaminase family protein [Rubritalea squalenifaciens]SHJ67184.1 Transglutaminase-like enzyme, putative cysteine protease [Rubritalea squalenifaciens DSM 18772]
MSVRFHIQHTTRYDYDDHVSDSHHIARLSPLESASQELLLHELKISPTPDVYTTFIDYFGNLTAYFSLATPHKSLVVDSISEVEISRRSSSLLDLSPTWEEVRDKISLANHANDRAASEFVYASPLCPLNKQLADYALQSFHAGTHIVEGVTDLTERIFKDFQFDRSASSVTTPVMETYHRRAGVCQDFAHFQISCLRSIGLPARYVSGYLRTEPPPGKTRLIGADASHAWISIYIPQHGWMEFDATNNLKPSYNHIRVAYGRDYHDICPVRGTVYGGGRQKLSIGVTVTPLDEAEPSAPDAINPTLTSRNSA